MDCSLTGLSLSMEFFMQGYCSGLPFLSPGELPDPRIEPQSPALQADFLLSEPPGKPCSVAKLCPTFCDLMDCSRPGFPVLHYLLKCAQTHIYWVRAAIQPSHTLLLPSSTALNLSQPKGLFYELELASGGQSIGASESVLPMNIQGWFLLGLTVWSPSCPKNSQESSPAPQFESINSLALSLLYGPILTSIHDYWENHLLVLFSSLVMSDSLETHEGQHARLRCPSVSSGVCPNSCSLSWWCHPTISYSVALLSSCPQSFPASGSFPMSWLFALVGQSIEGLALPSIHPSNEYSGLISFRMDWLDLLAVQGTLKSLLQHHSSKASILWYQPSLWSSSCICTLLLEKNHNFDYEDHLWQWCLCSLIHCLALS